MRPETRARQLVEAWGGSVVGAAGVEPTTSRV